MTTKKYILFSGISAWIIMHPQYNFISNFVRLILPYTRGNCKIFMFEFIRILIYYSGHYNLNKYIYRAFTKAACTMKAEGR